MSKIHPNIIRQLFSLLLILLMGYLIFKAFAPFLTGILGAITLYILLKKWMRTLVLEKKWKASLAASILMIVSFFVIIIPVGLTIMMLTSKIGSASNKISEFITLIQSEVFKLEKYTGIEISSNINTDQIGSLVTSSIESLLGSTFNMFLSITIMYFLLYYMLVNRKQFIESIYTYLPLRAENISIISNEVNSIIESNAIGIPLVAFFQGVVALIGFYIFGVPNPWFWFVITAIGSMIPFVGTAIGIIPVVIILFSSGQNWQAVAMLIYGVLVVGTTDNLFRLIVQKRLADIHPLITLIGVIIGVPIFGFLGLIFGPLLLSLFLLLLKLYKKEFIDDKDEIATVKSASDKMKSNQEDKPIES